MKKTFPIIRSLRIVQFIQHENRLKRMPNKAQIFDNVAANFNDLEYTNQMFDRDKKRIKDELGIDLMTEGQRYFIDESDSVPEISNVLDYYEMLYVPSRVWG